MTTKRVIRLAVCFPFLIGGSLSAFALEGVPTSETVRFVLSCMANSDGGFSDETLYSCACRHDAILSKMNYSEYEEGVTYERNRSMPGEKGNFFRDNKRGESFFEKLTDVRKVADSSCRKVKRVELRR